MVDIAEYVIQSNLIEGDRSTKGGSYSAHYDLVAIVQSDPQWLLKNVCAGHALLAPALSIDVLTGEYRKEEAFFGSNAFPSPEHLPDLMVDFYQTVQREAKRIYRTTELLTKSAWVIHNKFVCIHPFADGNGRMARLIFNAFLQLHEKPWHIFHSGDISQYFSKIRKYEEEVFKRKYPHVYTQTSQ